MAGIHFAPLQGYTDSVYREAHTRVFGGVDTYYTPFVRIEKGGFRNKDLKDFAYPNSIKNLKIRFSKLENPGLFGAASLCYDK